MLTLPGHPLFCVLFPLCILFSFIATLFFLAVLLRLCLLLRIPPRRPRRCSLSLRGSLGPLLTCGYCLGVLHLWFSLWRHSYRHYCLWGWGMTPLHWMSHWAAKRWGWNSWRHKGTHHWLMHLSVWEMLCGWLVPWRIATVTWKASKYIVSSCWRIRWPCCVLELGVVMGEAHWTRLQRKQDLNAVTICDWSMTGLEVSGSLLVWSLVKMITV